MSHNRASTPFPSPRAISQEELETIEVVPLLHSTVPNFATRSYSVNLRSDSLESIKKVKSRPVASQTDPQLDPNFVRKSDIASQTDSIFLEKSDLKNLASKNDLEKIKPKVRFHQEGSDKRILTTVENTQSKLCWCLVPILLICICVLILILILIAKIYNS